MVFSSVQPSSSSQTSDWSVSPQENCQSVLLPIHDMNTETSCSRYQGSPSSPYTPKYCRRTWEKVRKSRKKYTNANDIGLPLVVMSYNILAQALLENHKYLYDQSPVQFLQWSYRFSKIIDEISYLKPDFACLQEIQASHLSEISEVFQKMGYSGIYKQRTGIREDGCAIFYKSDSFKLLNSESVEFRQPDVSILNRDNIGLMGKFVSKTRPSVPFVICTTHLLYNPNRNDVRIAQMQVFLAEIDRFSFEKVSDNSFHVPTILTGDFNSSPDSPLTKLINQGYLDSRDVYPLSNLKNLAITSSCQHLGVIMERNNEHPVAGSKLTLLYHSENKDDSEETYISHEMKSHLFNKQYVRHHLGFKSVYDHYRKGEIEATTHQDDWTTVDYIYYNTNDSIGFLELKERLRLPTESECVNDINKLPNHQFGSDHLSLCAKFLLYSSDSKL